MTLAPSGRRVGLATGADAGPGGGWSDAREVRAFEARSAVKPVGLLAIAASGLYFVSDVIEAVSAPKR